ncbi:MAG: hypothetical protein JSR33_08130 [Proteobacteria bacterium]|nr:hypothetical protein [Pseudomonadota bacterium]
MAEQKSNLISELKSHIQTSFLETILNLPDIKLSIKDRAIFQKSNTEKLKSILLICASRGNNKLLFALLKIGAGKSYDQIDWLDEDSHPLYVCGLNNNLEGFKIFLQCAPQLYQIKVQLAYVWYYVAHLFLLERKFDYVKAVYESNPEFFNFGNSSNKNLGHLVFSGLSGDPTLEEKFTLVFSRAPQLFTVKNAYERTPWEEQQIQHPKQTPEVLLKDPNCYDHPEYKKYLPEKTKSKDKDSISALTNGSLSTVTSVSIVPSHRPSSPPSYFCEGQCLVM